MAYTPPTFVNGGAPPLNAANLNALGRAVQYLDQAVCNVQSYGAKGDGTTDDTAALIAAVAAASTARVPVYLPPGTYKITSTIPVPNHRLTLVGGVLERGRGTYPASGGSYSATVIAFQPASAATWLFDEYETSVPGAFIGPYVFENITFSLSGNGFRIGRADVNNDGTEDLVEDGVGQRYVFAPTWRGCQITSTITTGNVHTATNTMARTGQALIQLTKAFESVIEETSLYGGDIQIDYLGCDRPVIQNVRGGNCAVGIRARSSGTFGVDHVVSNYQIEGFTLAAVVNRSAMTTTSIRAEAFAGTYEGKQTLTETCSTTAGSATLTFSGSMTNKLFPGISVLTLTSPAGDTINVLVKTVSGTTVTIDQGASDLYCIIPWTATGCTVVRYHGYAILNGADTDGTHVAAELQPNVDTPGFIYCASRGGMNVVGCKSSQGASGDNRALIVGNRAGEVFYMNARAVFAATSTNLCPDPIHPMAVVLDQGPGGVGGKANDGGRRSPFGSPADLAAATTERRWVFTPKSGSSATYSGNLTPFVEAIRNTVTGEKVWAWRKPAASNVVCEDDTFPSNSASVLRVRMLARALATSSTLSWTFQDNGGTGGTSFALTATWQVFEQVLNVPFAWQTTGAAARTITIDGGDALIAAVVVEEFPPGTMAVSNNGIVSSSPAGTLYKLTPPNGGGAASWVVA